ncbi:MAG: 3'-5' exonuclease [Bacteroidales bacterium]
MGKNYLKNIEPEEIRELELKSFEGEIIVADTQASFRKAITKLSGATLLGFDTETRPSFRKGKKNKVSLLQLSDGSTACLFRINKIGMPDELLNILTNPAIIKAGVAVRDDLRVLAAVRSFIPAGFAELQSLVKDHGIESSGLKKLVAIILNFRISKSQQVTDWEAEELSGAQKLYAATDAWVCYLIYKQLFHHSS